MHIADHGSAYLANSTGYERFQLIVLCRLVLVLTRLPVKCPTHNVWRVRNAVVALDNPWLHPASPLGNDKDLWIFSGYARTLLGLQITPSSVEHILKKELNYIFGIGTRLVM